MSVITKDLGIASAYGYAKSKGYTGTEEEFAELMASYADVAQQAEAAAQDAEDAKDAAVSAKNDAVTAKTAAQAAQSAAETASGTATTKASEAAQSAQSAAGSASAAQTSATAASGSASTAQTAAQTATNKASEASSSASAASTAKTGAETARTGAQTAQTAAETAQTNAEAAASSVSASAAQIEQNTEDIAGLKNDLNAFGITGMIMPLDPNKFTANRYYAITDNSIGTATINTHTGSTSWNIYGAYQVNDGDRFVIPKNGNSRADVGLYDTDGILRGYVNGVRGQATEVICSVNGYTIGYISLSVTTDGNANDVFIIKIFEPYYTENTSKYIADAKTGKYVFIANEYRLSLLDGLIDEIPTDNLTGKTLYVVGDSISYGSNNDGQSYADKIADKHSMQLTKYTTPGATWKQNAGRTCLLTVVNNITVSQPVTEPDYMIISGGYNDAQNSILSTLGDVKISETDDNSASFNGVFDTDTFCGSIERAIYLIRKYYPNTRLMYVITYDVTSQKEWSQTYSVKIREICKKWSVPYCDIMEISGLICNSFMPEYASIFTDGVHPNDAGQTIIAKYVNDTLIHLYN